MSMGPAPTPQRSGAATPDDSALIEALAVCATSGRLSDAHIRAMRRGRRRMVVATGAAVLVMAAGSLWLTLRPAPEAVLVAHLETQRGERRTVRLADGSTVRMDGATRLDVRLEPGQRRIALAQGQAYFDVAHDPARPFDVVAGRSSTRVLGTAFDIDIGGASVKLTVYRGQVRFGPALAGDGVIVPAGWRSQFRGGVAAAPTRFNRDRQDWRDGWLDTDAMRLKELVDTLNRGSGPMIAAPGPALADLPLSGRFKLDDPRQLLGALGEVYGFTVIERDDMLILHQHKQSHQ